MQFVNAGYVGAVCFHCQVLDGKETCVSSSIKL